MKDFYKKYNLSNDSFAGLAHVGVKTLKKYIDGKPIRHDSECRIIKARKVIEDNDLKRPVFDKEKSFLWGSYMIRSEHQKKLREYERLVNEKIKEL